jgi:hypothetical protein
MLSYDFSTQKKIGLDGEKILDSWLGKTYQISDVSSISYYQKAGIDRVLSIGKHIVNVEYKLDMRARQTQNIFFEHISQDHGMVPGWGWSSQADYWIFLIPDQKILVIEPGVMRCIVWQNKGNLDEKCVRNQTYNTLGYPLPISRVESAAKLVVKLPCDSLPPPNF